MVIRPVVSSICTPPGGVITDELLKNYEKYLFELQFYTHFMPTPGET